MRIGDIYSYYTDKHHCRERVAVAVAGRDGEIVLLDTYWATTLRCLTDDAPTSFLNSAHVLTEDERKTIELQFNFRDYRPAHPYEDLGAYEPGTVVSVSSQHGHDRHHFVKPDAERSNAIIIQRQRDLLAKHREEVNSAQRSVNNELRELDRMMALVEKGEQL